MSFILDALRKSEHERQRGAVPGISHVPFAAPRRDLPRWAFVVIGVLILAVLGLGGAWWRTSTHGAAESSAAASSVSTVPLEVPVERRELSPPARTADPESLASAVTQTTPLSPSARSSPPPAGTNAPRPSGTTAPTTPAPTMRTTPAFSSPPARIAPQAAAVPDSGAPTLPSATALAAEGIQLPDLRLELHAYSERPSERFVFINGRKYLEGDRLSEGPQLVAIEPAGAVLLQQGRRFLLAPN